MSDKKRVLASRLLEAVRSPMWEETVLPYLEGERAAMIELMASLTDALQLMRYAGSIQTLNSLIHLEKRAKEVLEQEEIRKTS